ncbi:MAG: hypothetical protein CSB55_07100 [Candidatus Cloacimonadota bacterium]|nr:MAG: hypothetical protein CSB55_07100 [Candidatus Cloacimonadota bacterium]
MKKELKNKFETALLKSAIFLFALLPYSATKKIITGLFVFIGYRIGIRKKLALRQLRYAFPEKSEDCLKRIAKRMYYLMGQTAAENFFGNDEKLIKESKFTGFENMEKALACGKGVILVTAHMGNWELAAKAKAMKGKKLSVVIKALRNKFFEELTNAQRRKYNMTVIYKKRALRPILKSLENNETVCFVADQNARKEGIRLNVFDHPASVFTGWAKIAAKTGSPIVPGFAYHDNKNRNCFEYLEPVLPPENAGKEDVYDLVKKVSRLTEKYIKRHPADWFWVHKRWKGAHQAKTAD